MDDENPEVAFRAGSIVRWSIKGKDLPETGTLLYLGTEGDISSGIQTIAYVIRHSDMRVARKHPLELKFDK